MEQIKIASDVPVGKTNQGYQFSVSIDLFVGDDRTVARFMGKLCNHNSLMDYGQISHMLFAIHEWADHFTPFMARKIYDLWNKHQMQSIPEEVVEIFHIQKQTWDYLDYTIRKSRGGGEPT